MRVMVADDDDMEVSQARKLHEKHDRVKGKGTFEGRPWSLYEGYEIILLHQVEALIRLGAHPRLKDLVFKLWVNYLHKLDVAFTDEPSPCEVLQKMDRQREKFRGTTRKPRVKNVLSRKSLKQTVGVSQKKVEKQLDREALQETLIDEEFDDGENPVELKGNVESDLDWSSGDEDVEENEWGRYRRKLHNRDVHKVKMASTACLCYLGLMFTNPATTIADIVRWIRTDKLPYRNAALLLPEEMKFCLNDWKCFGMGTIPSSENLRLDTGRLAVFLNLANIPNYPLLLLLHKYILQLDLPAEIHGYAANILHATFPTTAYELNEKRKKLPFWEGMAMASIILTLKLFLGVNDSTERLMSSSSCQLQGYTDQKLFVWDDWVKHIKEKQLLLDIRSNLGHGRVEDDTVDALIHRVEAIQYSDTHGRLYKRDVRESLKQPFTELAERWAQTDSGSHRNQPSNKVNTDHSDTKNDPSLVFSSSWVSKVSREKRMEKLGEKIEEDATHLKHSTIEHLVNPECFTSSLNNPDTSVDPFINDFDESFESPEKRPKTYGNSHGVTRGNFRSDGGNAFTMMTEKTKCEAILARLTDLKDKLASSANTCVTQSVSYNWLLGVCSELIESEADLVHMELGKLEVKLLGGQAGSSTRKTLYHLAKAEKVHFNNKPAFL
ncbi:TATA box-binding protein-associated factor RNA polymerase I subunit B-like [Mya arenaria]|uniref:TATA box-binding protein-associated factor RNA polymerase I subunit B-like n=1 Tax=Mya arenaria TaxID=6604 RepID=UPI0022E17AE9|nr:TATA box-binding protein-associated factor RNA polymerase I subunit B-like [Mya arenaria]